MLSVLVPCARDNWKWSYNRFIDIYNDIKEPNKKNKFKELLDYLNENKKKPNKFTVYLKIVLLFIMAGIGFFLIFLIIPFYLYWLNKGYQAEKRQEEYESEREKLLYYQHMGGAGTVICIDCGFKEEIISFIHGHGDDNWANVGHQCQSCGKFHTLDSNSENLVCSCGGKLSCEEPIFCPICKSKNMSYSMSFIT